MRLVLKTHRVVAVAIVQAILATIGSAYGAVFLMLPGLGGRTPIALLLALLGVLLIAPTLVHAWPSNRTNASRRPGLIAAAVVLLQITPALLVAGTFVALGTPDGAAYVGMLLWLLAIQLAAGTMLSATYQGVAPAVYVFLCVLVGRIDSAVQPWAWPLAEVDPRIALLLGSGAFFLALVLLGVLGLHDRHRKL